MASGMNALQTIQAHLSKRIRAIRTRIVLFTQRLFLWIQVYLSTCPFPPQESTLSESSSSEELPPPFIDEVPTLRTELRTPSGRLPSEQQLLSMYKIGKEEGRHEALSGPPIHQVPVPVAPLCKACLKEGQLIPLWKDPISEYETYSYCPKCAIEQGKHYPPVSVSHPELREQLAVRRVVLRHEMEALTHHACFTPFTSLSYAQETSARMGTVKDTDVPLLNESEVTTKRPVVKKVG